MAGGERAETRGAGGQGEKEDADDQARGQSRGTDDVGEPAGPEDLVPESHETGKAGDRTCASKLHRVSVRAIAAAGPRDLPVPSIDGPKAEESWISRRSVRAGREPFEPGAPAHLERRVLEGETADHRVGSGLERTRRSSTVHPTLEASPQGEGRFGARLEV